jgi:predicted dehydrogenase
VPCETWDNAVLHSWSNHDGSPFPLTTETKRIQPGEKNTWLFEAIGVDGGVRFSTKNPKRVEVFARVDVPGIGAEQTWQQLDVGSQSVWPTVTGGIFESGFSDAILQMWAAFLAERAGLLDDRFGCVTPDEAAFSHRVFEAAMRSQDTGASVAP